MITDLKKKKESLSSFVFYWFLGIYPFLVLLNSFGYTNIFGLYIVNMLLSVFMIFSQSINIRNRKFSFVASSLSISLIIIMTILMIAGGDIFGKLENGVEKSVLNYFLPFVINSFGLLCLGYSLNLKKVINSPCIIILLLPAFFILFHVKGVRLDYSLLRDQSLIGIYLIIGDALCISAVFLCFRKGINFSSFILMVFFLIVLYLNNSRASFFVFFVGSFITVGWYLFTKKTFTMIVLSICLFIFTPFIFDDFVSLLSLNDRMSLILSGGSDYSSNSRWLLLSAGIQSIIDNWFLGDIGGQIHSSGRLGGYIHNILVYWRQFGLIPFVLLFLPITFILFYMASVSLKVTDEENNNYIICFMCLVIAVTMIFFARSIPYYLLFFAIGLADNFRLGFFIRTEESSPLA